MQRKNLKPKSDQMLEEMALRFKALSEVNRLKIVERLQVSELSVNQIVEATGLSQPNVSRHLSVLTAAKLIGRRKVGLSVLYRITDESLKKICAAVCASAAKD